MTDALKMEPATVNHELVDKRSCTCPPNEAPVPCVRRYALSECLAFRDGAKAERERILKRLRFPTWTLLNAVSKVTGSTSSTAEAILFAITEAIEADPK